MARILICGDREWTDSSKIDKEVKKLSTSDLIIHGGASGADTLADELGKLRGIPVAEFKANWKFYGRAAGPIRNGWMIKFGNPSRVIAFHSNLKKSKGTADMVRRAKKANIQVKVVK